MGIDASYNFRRVSETVTTSGLVAGADLAGLKGEGYDVLINLLPDSSEHAIADEARIVTDQGISYEYIPVDFAAPTAEQLQQFAAVMDAHSPDTIHVHCAANYRVSVFYSLYAVRRGWWSVEDADKHIHSIWTPNPVWRDFIASERARLVP